MGLRFFSRNPSKRTGEIFFAWWTLAWILFFGYIVVSRWFEDFTAWHYMGVGFALFLPPILIPILFPLSPADRALSWYQRYATKANLWVFLFNFVGNYLWTHYFYNVLGCSYLLDVHRINDVPIAFFMITQSYFLTYYTFSVIGLRLVEQLTSTAKDPATNGDSKARHLELPSSGVLCFLSRWFVVFFSSIFMAFMEAFTLENYPYYAMKDRMAMYKYGTVFYSIYFIVSFPMFRHLDEKYKPSHKVWSLGRTATSSLAAAMVVTLLLDFWRLFLGPIV